MKHFLSPLIIATSLFASAHTIADDSVPNSERYKLSVASFVACHDVDNGVVGKNFNSTDEVRDLLANTCKFSHMPERLISVNVKQGETIDFSNGHQIPYTKSIVNGEVNRAYLFDGLKGSISLDDSLNANIVYSYSNVPFFASAKNSLDMPEANVNQGKSTIKLEKNKTLVFKKGKLDDRYDILLIISAESL
jgi:hypothetical protein